jgi:hypothetical protein
MRTFFQGIGLPQTAGAGTGSVPSPSTPTAAVLARRKEVAPVVVAMVRMARQAGYVDATGPAALGISDTALRAALSAALRSSEPGYPSFYDDGILDIFFDSSTVIYATYPTGTALFWWQSYTISADRKNVKLNGDRQEVQTGWIPAGPVATPPAPIAPTANARGNPATPTAATRTALQTAMEVVAFSRGASPMPYSPPRIFDAALHAMGRPGIGETPAEYAAARTTRPGPDVAAACLSRSVMQAFSIDELALLESANPAALAPLATAGRNADSHARAFRALGQTPNPNLRDCDIYALSAARSAVDRAKASMARASGTASGSAHPSPCGCGGHPTASATTPATNAATGRPRRVGIYDQALIDKGLPPIGGK